MKRNKDMFGHYKSPNHVNTNDNYKKPKIYHPNALNSVQITLVDKHDWFAPHIDSWHSRQIETGIREFHNEVCGCNYYRCKLIDSVATLRSRDTSFRMIAHSAQSIADVSTDIKYIFSVRCRDVKTFSVQLALHPKYGESNE